MASTHPSDAEIHEFWAWFQTNAQELGRDFHNSALLAELDTRLACIGVAGWELGPGSATRYALAISPDGNRDQLPLTKRIVALSPTVPHWVFLAARPARPSPFLFTLQRNGQNDLAVDASEWRYVLYRFPDGLMDIVLEQARLQDVSEEERYMAATIMLDALMGEAERLTRFREIEPVATLDTQLSGRSSPVSTLLQHLRSLS